MDEPNARLPVVELITARRIKPQTPEQRSNVFACFNALEERGIFEGLQLTLQLAQGFAGIYVYATRLGYRSLEDAIAIAGEFGLKTSIGAEQYVANDAGLSLFGGAEGAPHTYARFALLIAPVTEYEEVPQPAPGAEHAHGNGGAQQTESM